MTSGVNDMKDGAVGAFFGGFWFYGWVNVVFSQYA
jgi:hypothetical protein